MTLPACCTDFDIIYPKLFFPEYQSQDEMEFLEAHGVSGMTLAELQRGAVDVNDLTVKIKHRCAQLGDDGLCKIYERRPRICRAFDCNQRTDCSCGGKGVMP